MSSYVHFLEIHSFIFFSVNLQFLRKKMRLNNIEFGRKISKDQKENLHLKVVLKFVLNNSSFSFIKIN